MKLVGNITKIIKFDEFLEKYISEGKPVEHSRSAIGLTDLVFVSSSFSDAVKNLVTGIMSEDQNPFDFLKAGHVKSQITDQDVIQNQYRVLYLLIDFLTNGPVELRGGGSGQLH